VLHVTATGAAFGWPFVHLGAIIALAGTDLIENSALPPSQLRKTR
jgi:hypothetical protein